MSVPGSLPALSPASILLYAYWLPLLGVMGPLAVHCGLTKAEEQEMRYLSCRELCCKLSTAVWDLPEKTLHPCTTWSPQTPWNLVLICCHSLFCKSNISVPLIQSQPPPPENCHTAILYMWGPIFFLPCSSPRLANCAMQGSSTVKIVLCIVKSLQIGEEMSIHCFN